MFVVYHIIVALWIVAINVNCEPLSLKRPLVETPLGKIEGIHKTSFKKRQFSAFEGIPYAKPPVGLLRFTDPQPVEPWSGVWDASHLTTCAQTVMRDPSYLKGDEDCLYVNVYVPRSNPDIKEKLDVVVHIHAGAFMFGSGHAYANPNFFMDTDLILVTFNYRLGMLGFLSTEDDAIPGNFGLKDQVLALKWVQQNIAGFGGNPSSVTLTGLAAGAASVHLHFLSPMSKGLFHRGFSQSGTALNPWVVQKKPLQKAEKLGVLTDCPTTPTSALARCLRQKTHTQLLSQMQNFYGFMFTPIAPFAPVVEKGRIGAFLNKDPYYLLAKKKVLDIPWITSNTAHEGLFPGSFFYDDLPEINKRWEEIAPFFLEYNDTLPLAEHKSTAKKLKDRYFGEDQDINTKNFPSLVKLIGERRFLTGTDTALRLHARANKEPVYYCLMTYPGENNPNNTLRHGADSQYFFGKEGKVLTENELKLKDAAFEMMSNFAGTGTPTMEGVTWNPVSNADELTILNVSSFEKADGLKMQTVKELADKTFWTSVGFMENENLFENNEEF